jgi:hypothetical protein
MDTSTLIGGTGIALLASVLIFGNEVLNEYRKPRSVVLDAALKRKPGKPIFALLGAFLLSGAVSGCATFEKCGLEGCPGDQTITGHVKAMLEQHPDLDANLLTVQTLKHVVYLDGIVESDLQSDTAATIAKHVRGVTEVVNNISVNNN